MDGAAVGGAVVGGAAVGWDTANGIITMRESQDDVTWHWYYTLVPLYHVITNINTFQHWY